MATYYFPSSNQRDVIPTPYLSLDSYNDPPRLPDNIMYPNQASTAVSYSELYNCVEIPSIDSTQHIGHQILDGQQDLQYQELSLSLGMQIPSSMHLPSFQYHYTNAGPAYSPNSRVPDSGDTDSRSKRLRNDEYLSIDLGENARNTINRQCSISPKEVQSVYEPSGLVCRISSSKYLKSAQLLLDEVVNVHEALNVSRNGGVVSEVHESTANSSAELSPAERQDLQSKMTKLSSMLDEVDKRYKQYYHHMKIVEASFEMVAGCGAAKPYTRLALHTISRQFRRLRDAINKQIQVISQSLGEQCVNSQVLPRLRYVEKQLRQQRIGVVQNHSWRPQRGLPESSVLILRAWLFEHFLHPYPKDSEKIMLARQTCLTRSQVANWFINARVRLWKPMVEDMYKEEFGDDSGVECKSSPTPAPKAEREKPWASDDRGEELQESVTSTAGGGGHMTQFQESKLDLIHDIKMNGFTTGLCFQNDGAHGDDTIDYGLMNLRGDHGVCPEEIITLDQW